MQNLKHTGKKKPLSSYIAEATLPKGGVLPTIMANALHFVNNFLLFLQCNKAVIRAIKTIKLKEFRHGSA